MLDQMHFDVALISLLFIASTFDLIQRRIPNWLLLSGLVTALVMHVFAGSVFDVIATGLAGVMVGLAMFLPLYVKRAMAAGDVKLMATVGAFVGPALALQICIATYCTGGVLALLIVLTTGRGRTAFTNIRAFLRPVVMRLCGMPAASEPMPLQSVGGMPYAIAISLGTLLILWWRHY